MNPAGRAKQLGLDGRKNKRVFPPTEETPVSFSAIRADRLSNRSNLATPRRRGSNAQAETCLESASFRVWGGSLLSLKKSRVCGTFVELW